MLPWRVTENHTQANVYNKSGIDRYTIVLHFDSKYALTELNNAEIKNGMWLHRNSSTFRL
ncbi:hypothetical protein SAMN05216325_13122 [Nitrosomonas marina]|uniref:Uncharacterized protein n=1 Tax=Nitrosomonas marina TaxID=917 RepID=A0A1H8IFI8_9PROT|nr:hypothetical protein SAMN05216325_13122 [Nitrosomonas marina]